MKPTRSLFTILILLLISLLLASCASAAGTPVVTETMRVSETKIPTVTPFPTNTQVPTQTPTNTPTFTPTPTPTPIPAALQGTPFTLPNEIMSSENASQVTQLARWGNGVAHDVQYSPDGKYIVVSSTIGLYLFNAETHNIIKTFKVYKIGPKIIDFLQAGESLALLSDGQVEIISFPDGELLEKFGKDVISATFSKDKDLVALAYCSGTENCSDTLVKTYTRKGLDLIDTFEIADRPLAVTFSPDGTLLGLRTRGQVILWRLTDKIQLIEYGPTPAIKDPHDIEFSPDGKSFAISTRTDVRLYNSENGTLEYEIILRNNARQNFCVEFSPDGNSLAIGSSRLNLWDFKNENSGLLFADEYLYQHGGYTDLSWSPSGDSIITASDFDAQPYLHSTTLWGVDSLSAIGNLEGFDSQIKKVSWSPNSKFLARDIAFGWNGHVQILKTADGEVIQEKILRGGEHRGLVFVDSPLFPYLENFLEESNFQLLSNTLDNDQYILIFGVEPITISPDGFYLAWANWRDDSIQVDFIKRMADQEALHSWEFGEKEFIVDLKFDPESKNVFAVSWNDGNVYTLNIYNGSLQRYFLLPMGSNQEVSDLSIAPDGNTFITAHRDGTFQIFQDGEEIMVLDEIVDGERKSRFPVVDWSPEGTIIALSGFDGTILLIRPTDGEVLHTLEGHTLTVTDLVFSPDGKMLVSVSEDGTTRIWGIHP